MFIKKACTFFIIFMPLLNCFAADFLGEWIYDVGDTGAGGHMTISDCKDNTCNVEFMTSNGAHICELDKSVFNIKKNIATAKIHDEYSDENCQITMTLQSDGMLDVSNNNECRSLCGMSGYFTGLWRKENTPKVYSAGFDCVRAKTDIENTICHNRELAQMDTEMSFLYKQVSGQKSAQKKWIADRNKCGADVTCLADKYASRMQELVTLIKNNTFNWFDYADAVTADPWFHPNNAILIERFIRHALGDASYEKFISCSNRQTADVFNENQIFAGYGCPGLFTIMERAIYIDKNQIWLSYLDDGEITVYGPKNKKYRSIPSQLVNWIEDLKNRAGDYIKSEHTEYKL